jgi:hypothetical protein
MIIDEPDYLRIQRELDETPPTDAEGFANLRAAFTEATVLPFEPNTKPELLRVADEALADDPAADGFRLVPLDFTTLLASGIPEVDYLEFPYVARQTKVWAFGAAESAKTIFFQWLSAKLTRAGGTVVFVSQENPLATDLDRIARLRPDFDRLRYFHMAGLDLADRSHFTELVTNCVGADVVIFDTLSASWSGDEASNAEVVALDRDVLSPLVRLTHVTPVVIHHTGHPQAFVNRGGVGAGRGASAMGQKADTVLVFQTAGQHEFTIHHAKSRSAGGYKAPTAKFRIVDTADGGLDIEHVGRAIDPRVAEAMDAAIEIIAASDGTLGTNALTAALKEQGFGGSTIDPALMELRAEDPPRVRQVDGQVVGRDGKQRKGRPWVTA